MKVHLRQIPADGLHLEGEEKCLISELETDELRCAGPLRYELDLGISDGSLWASGSLTQPVELRCVSCLDKFVHEINVPAFAVHTELSGPETIDLAPYMREDLLLSMPAHPHCDRDGGKTCKGAAPKLSKFEEDEAAAKREHDWEVLDKLKLKR
jgi:uncharacterized metal-binding protein YceD (DUF177 family)